MAESQGDSTEDAAAAAAAPAVAAHATGRFKLNSSTINNYKPSYA